MSPIPEALDQILTVDEMVRAEQRLMDNDGGVDDLMEKAGQGAAQWIWRVSGRHSCTILCGPGNNGGDGYVIAEWLRRHDVPVTVIAPIAPKTPAAKRARALYAGKVLDHARNEHSHAFVDCLFGSGLSREIGGELKHCLDTAYARAAIRIAVDLPSGVASDTGALLGIAGPYDLCIALGAWKFAHALMPASAMCHEVRLVDIGIDQTRGHVFRLRRPHLAAPTASSHKYSRGKVLIISGPMTGAAVMSAEAAQSSGAGYVALAGVPGPATSLSPDIVDHRSNADEVLRTELGDQRVAAVLVGPGLGRNQHAEMTLQNVLGADLPTVLDADALHVLTPRLLGDVSGPVIMTPHAGEFSQLCSNFKIGTEGLSKAQVTSKFAMATRSFVIQKGPDTVIADPGGNIWLYADGPSWLSVAGTGDVLAGCVAARLAVTRHAQEAARQAVWLHGRASKLAGPAFAASQLPPFIRHAMAECL